MKLKRSIARGQRAPVGKSRTTTACVSAQHAALSRAFSRSLLAFPVLFAVAPAGAAVQFSVVDLGTLGGSSSSATAINGAGQVVGNAGTSGNAASRAFLWQSGSMQDLGTLGGTSSYANGVNAAGQVVGYAHISGNAANHAFLWQSGSMQDLGTLGGTRSDASGINAAGQVVGTATTSNAASHAFLWQSGRMQDLGTLGGTFSYGNGINAAGQVVGEAQTSNGAYHGFLWQSGSMQDLGTLGGAYSFANGINAAGQVVGTAYTGGDVAYHAFLWQSGSMQDLGTLGGRFSYANGINAAGQVVGEAQTSGGSYHAFLRGAQGGMVDLNALLVAGSGALVTSARGVNDIGQVVGTASIAGQTRAVLLTPTGSMSWLAGGTGGSFNDGANWEMGFAPSQLLDAVIAPAGAQTITASADAAVKSLLLGGAAGSSGRPQLILQFGATLSATDGVTVQATGTLGGDGRISGNLVNLGTVRADNLSVTGTFSNSGLVVGNGFLNANLNNAAAGQVRSGAGDYLRVVGSAHSNAGTLEVSGGATQEFSGSFANNGQISVNGAVLRYNSPFTNTSAGRLFVQNADLHFGAGAANSGQISASFGTSNVYGAVTTHLGGKIILSGNSNTTFYDAIDVESGGELRVSTGSTAVFFGAVHQRTGSIFSGSGSKFYEGGLSIGDSPGLGLDAGDVSFGSANTYLEEIGGLAAGTQFDKYVVAGKLGFGGSLKVVWWDGFVGQAGQSFDLFDWGSSEGEFSAIDFAAAPLAAGLRWDTSSLYSTGEISITAVPEPQSWGLLLAGLGVLGLVARRSRAAAV